MLTKSVGHVFPSQHIESIAPSQRLHLVLLGVANVRKSQTFYEALGWKKSATGHDEFVKFDLGGYALCLLSRAALAADALIESSAPAEFSGAAFVYLAKTPEEVPAVLAKAVAAGGALVKPATRTQWGIAGYFKDPDGHLFEVDYEEIWVFDEQGALVVDEIRERTV